MKGTIVSAWIETCNKLYGEEITDKALASVGIPTDEIFKPTTDIEDKKAIGFIEEISKQVNIPIDTLWETIGRNNIITYSKRYPAFFRYKNLYSFLRAMYDIHIVVTENIPGAKPPIVDVQPVGKYTAHMSYESSRKMFSFFLGMLNGAADFFNESIDVNILEKRNTFMKISIEFKEQIYFNKSYTINKLLSFGLIKSLPLKIAISSLLFVGLPAIILFKFVGGLGAGISTLLLSAIVPLLVSSKLFNPIQAIRTNLYNLKSRNLSFESDLETSDVFEDINNDLNELREDLRKNFIGYKGTTDELNVFADNFNHISENMAKTSEDVYHIMSDLSQDTSRQSDEITHSAHSLQDSIKSLNLVVEKEEINKNKLENVVLEINTSFSNLNKTINELNNVLDIFSNVESQGQKLQERASEVRAIVSTVERIAEQTNLLALNASIEASHAGEFGSGFSIVATEIRELAEHSKQAVQNINSNLESFIEDIDNLVNNISSQFLVLESESDNLNRVSLESNNSVESIEQVSELIVQLTTELIKETGQVNLISKTIENLSHAAENNSDHSKQATQNIQNYTEEIKSMTKNIEEFKNLSLTFSKDLDRYTM